MYQFDKRKFAEEYSTPGPGFSESFSYSRAMPMSDSLYSLQNGIYPAGKSCNCYK